jgi:uncharacterized surface protein with fasciclin (FAS1) repeats
MNTKILRRGTAAAAVLTMSLAFAACGEEDEPADNANDGGTSTSQEESPSEPMDSPSEDMGGMESSAPAGGEFDAVFGPACDQLPQGSEPGSLDSMVADPVATAAGTNPLLTTLVTAVGAVDGLAGTLDSAPADPGLTVFAPFNGAFEELGEDTVNQLVTQAQEATGPAALETPLAVTLQHHVVAGSLAPDAVVGEQAPLTGAPLEIAGDPESGMTVSDGTTDANVLCGGIPTGNATVYVIDQVLMGVEG